MIPGSSSAQFFGAAGASGGGIYEISRSLRFNSSDSAYLSYAVPSGTSTTFTASLWIKRSSISATYKHFLFTSNTANSGAGCGLGWTDGNAITVYNGAHNTTSAVYRDVAAWYYITLSVNAGTATLYVNGVQQVTGITGFQLNGTAYIGRYITNAYYFDGYMADIYLIDGQALDPASFTEVSATTGQLVPIAYTGSYGTNGFHLPFSDNSTAAALGTDTSGNGNTWTVNNITAVAPAFSNPTNANTPVYEISIGPTNPLSGTYIWSNAFDGTTATTGLIGPITFTGATKPTWSTSQGVELMADGNGITASVNGGSQVALTSNAFVTISSGSSGTLNSIWIYSSTGESYIKSVRVDGVDISVKALVGKASDIDSLVDTPTSYGTPDTGVGGEVRGNYCTWNPLVYSSGLSNGALDVAANQARGTQNIFDYQCYWEITSTGGNTDAGIQKADGSQNSVTIASGKTYGFRTGSRSVQYINITDGGSWTTWLTSANVGLTEPYFPYVSGGAGAVSTLNAGQRAFAAAAPSGYKALCDTNLTAPTIAKPSTVMDAKLYTGNGSTQTISGLGFSPDFVWIKERSSTSSHQLYDTIRGATKTLYSNSSNEEQTNANALTSFTSTGFNVGVDNNVNQDTQTYVAWTWDAGSSTAPNTSGSISSQVRVNTSAGFSIITYTGTGANATVGHGLGVAPSLIIVKARTAVRNWPVYHASTGASAYTYLDGAFPTVTSDTVMWQGVAPTSTVFSVGTYAENNGTFDYVAYCFAQVAGYSMFGNYTGNGSTDGPMVWTGFRPKFLLYKNSSVTANWGIYDASRDSFNVAQNFLRASLADAEIVLEGFDFLSNGFKVRTTSSGLNGSGNTIFFAAFAESPFKYARAR